MKIYTLTVQSVNENGTLDYSVINGVFQDKEAAKKFATDKLKEQAYFWKDSYTTKKSSDGYCAITLIGGKDKVKRYILQEHDVQ